MARHGLSLIDIEAAFGTEDQCLDYLESARWPGGVHCLKCGSEKVSRFVTNETVREVTDDQGSVIRERRVPARRLYQCNNEVCRHQFSAKAGTIFDKSHLPLTTWFKAIGLLLNAKKSVSAKQMERDLGVNYRTAWHLNHRIRKAMTSAEGLFSGEVEMDGTYIGGRYDPRRLRAPYDKQAVLGMVQRPDQDGPSKVRAFVVPKETAETVKDALDKHVTPGTQLYTDEHGAYRQLHKTWPHAIVVHSKDEYVKGRAHTNSIENFWSLFKRQINGQHHWVSVKHLQKYLDECQFKFNNRTQTRLFHVVILNLLINGPLRYAALTAPVYPWGDEEPSASE